MNLVLSALESTYAGIKSNNYLCNRCFCNIKSNSFRTQTTYGE